MKSVEDKHQALLMELCKQDESIDHAILLAALKPDSGNKKHRLIMSVVGCSLEEAIALLIKTVDSLTEDAEPHPEKMH